MLAACTLLALNGCSRFRPKPVYPSVYVVYKQTFLRDRVAAVSNRTATVTNGQELKVLEKGRRFLKVQTANGEVGWIDEKAVATQEIVDGFRALAAQHQKDSTVATAVVRDEVYLHVKPGRETDRFFLLQENEKLKLLARATLPKALPKGQRPPAPATPAAAGKPAAAGEDQSAAPVMEDWWLVRDAKGDTGWIYSRMIDVDVPDAVGRYAEGQRFVGAYVLTTVYDPDAEQADKNIPIYLTVLSPYKAGLPYDFDQVRVFTWNIKKHRYETAFRDKNIEGFLPVKIEQARDAYAKVPQASMPAPTFTYRVLAADAPTAVPDPVTGAVIPARTVEKTYRLEGNVTRRLLQPGTPAPAEAHPEPPAEKKKPAGRRRR
ncbi:MAG: SH3 domain-containing protein [Acidobacteriota bacterium]|nr:SH3 domain-containing protein [Acidobacteriota bacterium]